MTRRTYTPEYKAKLVIEVLQGEKELNTIAAENSISPNMLRNWKAEFLENAGRAFDGSRQAKEARRKEADLKKTQAQMLKTIGQLTLERDFLQDFVRLDVRFPRFLQKPREHSTRRQCELSLTGH